MFCLAGPAATLNAAGVPLGTPGPHPQTAGPRRSLVAANGVATLTRAARANHPARKGTRHRGAPGNTYDPRPHEDRARRKMAFLLFALLAVMVVALLAMVAFGIISVSEVKEFGVIIAALVPLVTVTIAYYFKSRDGSKK